MGQARRRGTFEERKTEAIKRDAKIKIIKPITEAKLGSKRAMNYLTLMLSMAAAGDKLTYYQRKLK